MTSTADQVQPQPLSLWTNEVDTVVAYNADDAQQVMADQIGCTLDEYQRDYEPDCWYQVEPSNVIKIYPECGYRDEPATIKSAAEWAQQGRGFLASTEC